METKDYVFLFDCIENFCLYDYDKIEKFMSGIIECFWEEQTEEEINNLLAALTCKCNEWRESPQTIYGKNATKKQLWRIYAHAYNYIEFEISK